MTTRTLVAFGALGLLCGCWPRPGPVYSTSGSTGPTPTPTPPPTITSVSTASPLRHPQGVVVSPAGFVYIADTDHNRVICVSSRGATWTVAGDGSPGFGGDGGLATSARLHHPTDLALGSAGDLYISDTDNHRIRRVFGGGLIMTLAGDGTTGDGGDGGPSAAARLFQPTGLAMGAGNALYIADSGNQRVRRIAGGIITTVAGDGTPGYSGDGGPATLAQLRLSAAYFRLGDVAVDAWGALLIADSGNHCIRRVGPSGVITTVAGVGRFGYGGDGGQALQAKLAFPAALARLPGGDILVADAANSGVRRIVVGTAPWTIWHYAGHGTPGPAMDGGDAATASLHGPMGLAVGATGEVYVADVENDRVRRIQ